MVSVRQAPKHYFVEFAAAILLYMASMYLRHDFAYSHPGASILKTVVLLSPILPSALVAIAILRFYRRMDEMQRRQMLESVGIGALVCALGSITLGFSHDVGLPPIGIIWAWPLMGAGWLAAAIWQTLGCSAGEAGSAATGRKSMVLIAIVAVPTLAYRFAAPLLGLPRQNFWTVLVATLMILIVAGWAALRREPQ